MAQLVQESCVLRFEEHEFIDFFGVDAPLDEDACSYSYELARDGLRFLFTVFPLDGGVYTSLYREGVDDPIVSSRLKGCTHMRFVSRNGRRFLEIGRPERPTTEPSAPPVWGLRISVDPHFRQEYIHEVA
jgi:hypothetical protein